MLRMKEIVSPPYNLEKARDILPDTLDIHSGNLKYHPVSSGPLETCPSSTNSFTFMQFSAKKCQIICWHISPRAALIHHPTPSFSGILDPLLPLCAMCYFKVVFFFKNFKYSHACTLVQVGCFEQLFHSSFTNSK